MIWASLGLFLAVTGLLLWGILRARRRLYVSPGGVTLPVAEVPAEVIEKLKPCVEELMANGFEFVAARKERQVDSSEAWQIISQAAEGRVWSAAGFKPATGELTVSMESYSEDGRAVLTKAGSLASEVPINKELPEGWIVAEGNYDSARRQAETHASSIQRVEMPLGALSLEAFLERHDRSVAWPLEVMGERGWLRLAGDQCWKISGGKLLPAALAELRRLFEDRFQKTDPSWVTPLEAASSVPESGPELEEPQPEPMPEEKVDPDLDEAVSEAIAATEAVATRRAPRDEVAAVEAESPAVIEKEESEEPSIDESIPTEEGLERDWALYQVQAARGSWAYWGRACGGGLLWLLSLFGLLAFLAAQGLVAWNLLIHCLIALILHEAGHALMMAVGRCWDWSLFLLPFPHPMKARLRGLGGGFKEASIILAGPLPGIVLGILLFSLSFSGVAFTDLVLDFALALVLMNLLTLLPFRPLDGGRLLDLLIFRSVPVFRVLALLFGGLVFLLLSPFGLGWLGILLAVFLWLGIPAAKKAQKLLPWVRANQASEGSEAERVRAVLNVFRQRSHAGLLKGPGWAASVDYYEGEARSRPPKMMGWLLAAVAGGICLLLPFALPAIAIGKTAQELVGLQKEAQSLAKTVGPKAEMPADASEDLAFELDWLAESARQDPADTAVGLSSAESMKSIRELAWEEAGPWLRQDPEENGQVLGKIITVLARNAAAYTERGHSSVALKDLSVAFRILRSLEPRESLEAWVAWLELEEEVLRSLEAVSASNEIRSELTDWYRAAIRRGSQPEGPRMAAMLLGDAADFSLVLENGLAALEAGNTHADPSQGEFLPLRGRSIMSLVGMSADWLPVARLKEEIDLANRWRTMGLIHSLPDDWDAQPETRERLAGLLERIREVRALREVALAALAIKRGGAASESAELVRLENELGRRVELEREEDETSIRVHSSAGAAELTWRLR